MRARGRLYDALLIRFDLNVDMPRSKEHAEGARATFWMSVAGMRPAATQQATARQPDVEEIDEFINSSVRTPNFDRSLTQLNNKNTGNGSS